MTDLDYAAIRANAEAGIAHGFDFDDAFPLATVIALLDEIDDLNNEVMAYQITGIYEKGHEHGVQAALSKSLPHAQIEAICRMLIDSGDMTPMGLRMFQSAFTTDSPTDRTQDKAAGKDGAGG